MELSETLKSKNAKEMEEWFLSAVSGPELPFAEIMSVLNSLRSSSSKQQAIDLASVTCDALVQKGDGQNALKFLEAICGWYGLRDSSFRSYCEKTLKGVFKDRLSLAFIGSSGFDGDLPVAECLRRFRSLTSFKPGVLCLDKTWGFGIIGGIDEFYKKVTIDFTKKKGHQMSFAYAAEALRLLSDSHVLVLKHKDPAGIAALVKSEPAKLAKLVLTSYGPVGAAELKDLIVPEFVPEAGWKSYWDAARKALKADSSVVLPTSRNEPIRVLAEGRNTIGEKLTSLAVERDVDRILKLIDEMNGAGQLDVSVDRTLKIVVDRLGFVAKAASGSDYAMLAKVVIISRAILPREQFDSSALVKSISERPHFKSAVAALSGRDLKQFFGCLSAEEKEPVAAILKGLLPELPFKALSEVIEFMVATGREAEVIEVLKDLVATKTAGVDVQYWLCRNLTRMTGWNVGTHYELFKIMVDGFTILLSGEQLKIQNQLLDLVEDKDWIEVLLAGMEPRQRAEMLSRINNAMGWDQSRRRSVMARMIKLYPELGKVVAGGDEPANVIRYTSWRSFRARQALLKKVTEVDIPQNSKDIGIARSYGDLRENAEYKAAREMQGVLMRRQAELEEDLKLVRGTDFAGFPTEVVGGGTCVTLQRPDGSRESYCVLGEWDRDESLGIIGSKSLVAERLLGRKAGEEIMLPRANVDEPCKILSVGGLTDEVKAWIALQE